MSRTTKTPKRHKRGNARAQNRERSHRYKEYERDERKQASMPVYDRYSLSEYIREVRQALATCDDEIIAGEIAYIYSEKNRRNEERSAFGAEPLEVDHIWPVSPVETGVCGLNRPWNLQIIPRTTNAAKSNCAPEQAMIEDAREYYEGCVQGRTPPARPRFFFDVHEGIRSLCIKAVLQYTDGKYAAAAQTVVKIRKINDRHTRRRARQVGKTLRF